MITQKQARRLHKAERKNKGEKRPFRAWARAFYSLTREYYSPKLAGVLK